MHFTLYVISRDSDGDLLKIQRAKLYLHSTHFTKSLIFYLNRDQFKNTKLFEFQAIELFKGSYPG